MQRDADTFLSNNEKEFIVQALKQEKRIDGRGPYELREPKFQFSLDDSSCTVLLGQTRVMAVVAATLEAPYPDRPNEGSVRFNVEFSPMASPAFEAGRPGEEAIEVARLIERGLRESRAVDTEALVVVAGRKVWQLRVDIHVLDHQGNLVDACGLAALGALMAFRRPDVTSVIVHSPEVREPLPLSIHHLPVPVSFAFFEEGALVVVDPGLKEEAASAGGLTVTLNPHGELCAVQKARGVGLPVQEIMRCVRIAASKVEEITKKLKKALEAHAVARVQARVRRRAPSAVEPQAAPAAGGGGGAAADEAAAATTTAAATAVLPQPVQEILKQLEEEEEEDGGEEGEEEGPAQEGAGGDADMAPADGEPAGAAEGEGAAGAASEEREAPGQDGMGSAEQLGGAQQAQQGEKLGAAGSSERKKAKRKRRGGSALQQGQQGEEPDQFELIAQMIAGSRGGGGAAGLEGAVKQRTPGGSSSKRDKGPGK